MTVAVLKVSEEAVTRDQGHWRVPVQQDVFEVRSEEAVAKHAAAGVRRRLLLGKFSIAGRSEQLLVTVGENLQANGIERMHLFWGLPRVLGLPFGLPHFALHGLETRDAGKALELLFHVILGSG